MARVAPAKDILVWPDAHAMIREVAVHLPACRAISLDHDLYTTVGSPDPGDGLDIAKFLVSQPTVRPVIVHSTNAERARCMVGEFELANWPCTRVVPLGDSWIRDDWEPTVARLLNQASQSP